MPHFDYCATVLLMASDSQLIRLQRLQNKIMRVVLRCNRYTPSATMLNILQWLSIKQRVVYNSLTFIYKIKTGRTPQYLAEVCNLVSDVHNHGTRGASDFRLSRFIKATTQRSLYYRGLQIFNRLPVEAKQSTNFSQFKRVAVDFVKTNFKKNDKSDLRWFYMKTDDGWKSTVMDIRGSVMKISKEMKI